MLLLFYSFECIRRRVIDNETLRSISRADEVKSDILCSNTTSDIDAVAGLLQSAQR